MKRENHLFGSVNKIGWVSSDFILRYLYCLPTIYIKCKIVEGSPKASEHLKLIWLKREYIESLQWAPTDIPAVEQLMNEK